MEEILKQAFITHPFGVFAGIALIIICFFVGWGILINGWPKFKK
jgi:hypothetical protein